MKRLCEESIMEVLSFVLKMPSKWLAKITALKKHCFSMAAMYNGKRTNGTATGKEVSHREKGVKES